jgi:ABC-2 type transport system ATP-binding protein
VPAARRRTDEILRMIGLEDKAEAYARSLSGGMRRRLLLGKALVHNPQVLVLDEPTAGVDIELRQMLWENVRRLNREEGMTIILTTHYLEEAQEMCDEIAIINEGEKIVQDETSALVGRLDAKTLVITPEETGGQVGDIAVPEGVEMTRRPDGSLSFGYRRGQVSVSQILSAVNAAGVSVRDIATQEPDLEDVFLELTSNNARSATG